MDPIRENIGRPRGTNKGRSLDEFIRCRINSFYSYLKHLSCTKIVFLSLSIFLNLYIVYSELKSIIHEIQHGKDEYQNVV